MLSRIADSLFWLNRYMERANGLLRLSGIHYILSMDKEVHSSMTWKPVLQIFTAADEAQITLLENDTKGALGKLLLDEDNHNSLMMIIHKARENARGVQDHITKEVWEEINYLYHLINQPLLNTKLNTHETLQMIGEFTRHSVLFTGVMDITMPRGLGWCFMNLGKYVERCLQTILITAKQVELLDFSDNKTIDIMEWRYLLLSLSGYEQHLKTYHNTAYNNNVFHQVLLNENFTRSVIYSLDRIERYLDKVIQKNTDEHTFLLQSFGRMHSKIKYIDIATLNQTSLQSLLTDVKNDLLHFNQQLGHYLFSYS
jgi:uncharacterized alpha-E superfamily protein